MTSFLFGLTYLIAATTLDLDMDQKNKKNTGVYKLSEKEKTALQNWIDTHYEKRSAPVQPKEEMSTSMLQENLKNGRYIRLANGTLWNIHPSDTNISQGWITPVDIIVSANKDPDYPYKLTNSLTKSSIRARKVEETAKIDDLLK